MKSNLYPETFPYPNRYGITKVISPSWKNNLQTFHLKILSLFLAALLYAISGFGQGPCPGANCNSGDIRITKWNYYKLMELNFQVHVLPEATSRLN